MTEYRASKKLTDALQFIEQQKELGIELVSLDGFPTLHADPGMKPENVERWAAMQTAVEMLQGSRSEMIYLMRRGFIKLPQHPGF